MEKEKKPFIRSIKLFNKEGFTIEVERVDGSRFYINAKAEDLDGVKNYLDEINKFKPENRSKDV